MKAWKEAYRLSLHELKQYLLTYFWLFISLFFLLIFIVPTMESYMDMENRMFGIDILFLLTFTVIVQWCRPKSFRSQVSENGLAVSHHLIMLSHTPVPKDIIIKHRLLSYILVSVPFHIMFLSLLYALTPVIRETMPIGAYLVFSIFWICFGISFGCYEPALEAGHYRFSVILRNLLIGLIVTLIIFIFFNKYLTVGLIHWTMILSLKYPITITIISILLAGLGLVYWIRHMRKKMISIDYY